MSHNMIGIYIFCCFMRPPSMTLDSAYVIMELATRHMETILFTCSNSTNGEEHIVLTAVANMH